MNTKTRSLCLMNNQSPSTMARRCISICPRLLLVALFALCGITGANAAYTKSFSSDGYFFKLDLDNMTAQVHYTNSYYYLTTVDLPSVLNDNNKFYTVNSIATGAFQDCAKIKKVVIPETCTNISSTAFLGCVGVTQLQCNAPVNTMQPFEKMKNLETIEVLWAASDVPTVFKNNTKIRAVYFLGSSYTRIPNDAFSGCTALKYAYFYSTSLQEIGKQAFMDCSNLELCSFKSSLKKIGDAAFMNCSKLSNIPLGDTSIETIGTQAFRYCTAIGKVKFPATLTKIGNFAYANSGITNANNLSSTAVTDIGYSAFMDCASLRTPSYPSTLKTIGERAFSGDILIQSVQLGSTNVTSIGANAYDGCTDLSIVSFPAPITNIGAYAFANTNVYRVEGLENTKLTTIIDGLFYNCKSLTSVKLPNTLETIGSSAFKLSGLTSIALPEGVTTIGHSAFNGTKITTFDSPESLTDIGSYAFENCTKLTRVSFGKNMGQGQINFRAFSGCDILKTVTTTSTAAIKLEEQAFFIPGRFKDEFDSILIDYRLYDDYKEYGWENYFNFKFPTITNLSIDEALVFINEGETATITATVIPAEADPNVKWETDNYKVATVVNGTIWGISEGYANITVTAANGMKKVINVWVGQFGLFDINKDGFVNSSDVVALYNYILNGSTGGATADDFDINRDGEVNSADVVALYNYIMNGN